MSEIIIHNFCYPIMQINGQRITGPPRGFETKTDVSEIEVKYFLFNLVFSVLIFFK